ncbi:PAS domain-containing sensor histidine kinase [Ahrensia kielensis]|uniref:sensor histidine kinase n=1 Tax=Ahrensia kielensis TaxID=76980 RepID=UPI000375FF7E|nr:PAS domain-containing sensor histidine kinase [Ahrensia kielensis]
MEQKIHLVLKTIDLYQVPVFVLSVDKDEVIRFAGLNQFHQDATGVSQATVAGKTPHEVFPGRTADTLMRNYMHCVRTEQSYNYEEVLALAKGEQWWSTTLSPIFENGRITGIIGVACDNTPARKSEQDLAAAVQEVSKMNVDLRALTSTMAHDLRGPLRQAKLIMSMVYEGFQDLGDNKIQLLETGNDVIDRALDFIDSKLGQIIENNDLDNNSMEIDLGHWCSDIIAILDPLAELQIDYPNNIIQCEKFIIDIALRNIIENATKYAVSQVRVDISDCEGKITFSVSDDGVGFKKDYFESSMPLPTKQNKTGFGLPLTKSLIEARQGRIWLDEAKLAAGATVSFSLKGKILR